MQLENHKQTIATMEDELDGKGLEEIVNTTEGEVKELAQKALNRLNGVVEDAETTPKHQLDKLGNDKVEDITKDIDSEIDALKQQTLEKVNAVIESGEKQTIKSIDEMRTKAGVFLVQGFMTAVKEGSYEDPNSGPQILINTTSRAERGFKGKGAIDLALSVDQAKQLLVTLADALDQIKTIDKVTLSEDQIEAELDRQDAEDAQITKDTPTVNDIRNATGTLTAAGTSLVMANFTENYKNMGSKLLIQTMAEGRKLDTGKGSLDMAFSPEDAQRLYDSIKESIDQLGK